MATPIYTYPPSGGKNLSKEFIMTDIYLTDADDLADIRYDNVFKAVFARKTPESLAALSHLISAIIGRPLTVKSVIANEPPIDNLRDRQIRFDIHAEAENGELVDVEMSLNPDTVEPVRLEFYGAKLFTGQDIRGTNYNELKAAYQIAILRRGLIKPLAGAKLDPRYRVDIRGRGKDREKHLEFPAVAYRGVCGKLQTPAIKRRRRFIQDSGGGLYRRFFRDFPLPLGVTRDCVGHVLCWRRA
jgi:hypothetical protein